MISLKNQLNLPIGLVAVGDGAGEVLRNQVRGSSVPLFLGIDFGMRLNLLLTSFFAWLFNSKGVFGWFCLGEFWGGRGSLVRVFASLRLEIGGINGLDALLGGLIFDLGLSVIAVLSCLIFDTVNLYIRSRKKLKTLYLDTLKKKDRVRKWVTDTLSHCERQCRIGTGKIQKK